MGLILKYYEEINKFLSEILRTEKEKIAKSAQLVAAHIKQDKIFYVFGPGGHSNLASQEIFYRAGGLMHANAILDEGTLLSNGALRSSAMERMPGYGRMVIDDNNLNEGDLLILVNAYGINSAVIDAALEAKERGVQTIGICSVQHAENTPSDHPARHPSKYNLFEITDVSIDSKVEEGDAVLKIEGLQQNVGAISTFVNAFIVNAISIEATNILVRENVQPPIWKSSNIPGGDEWNQQYIHKFKGIIKKL
ncbi:sugar isomerase [Virgibacillus profundi]|uniref:Sugar isomerase n=1 Tax=Virgibacillus profundi TaxID=2024555 RepID=A0A2A2II04_9BACI|nr:SIS domain-containing protein [Virgibacillus profundi]PAV31257.1 sugar isomerase [Virgibacillus profundi]PXY55442.1 sugar isomerase domain-containing protein [Virgibacillus profundi]